MNRSIACSRNLLLATLSLGVGFAPIAVTAQSLPKPKAKPRAIAAPSVPLVAIANGTAIKVVVDSELTSGKAVVGEEFPLHVVEDVVANGYVVVNAGALGAGKITAATPAGKGTSGTLAYDIVYVKTVNDKKIRLTSNLQMTQNADAMSATVNDQIRRSATSTAASIGTSTVLSQAAGMLGPLGSVIAYAPGLFGPKKGREAIVALNTPLNAFVLGTVHVASNIKSVGAATARAVPSPGATDDGYAH